jgi:hypothetical protein
MANLTTLIPAVQESVVALLRIHLERPQKVKKEKVRPARFQCSWGSGFCVVADKYLITAFHLLNGGNGVQPRNPQDKFIAFVVPENEEKAFHFPVIGFPLEKPDLDLAILEIGPCSTQGIHLPGLAVTLTPQPTGTRVVTMGFPAPEIAEINLDPQGNYLGGQFFLKSHANEGIVSAHYTLGAFPIYEFNVGWHHGESGGPIVTQSEPATAFTLMQQYRNIQTPHGIVAGPHRGRGLYAIQQELARLGVIHD